MVIYDSTIKVMRSNLLAIMERYPDDGAIREINFMTNNMLSEIDRLKAGLGLIVAQATRAEPVMVALTAQAILDGSSVSEPWRRA